MAKCNCCEQEKELRLGICFDCADAENIIESGINMYDEKIPSMKGYSDSMAKLKYILKIYNILTH